MSEEYTKEQVLNLIQISQDFAVHVTNVTKKYIETLNLPPTGVLSGFKFELEKNQYTVNHSFIYENEQKQCFYVIPLNLLWDNL